ncbi:MAG: hypothetical protein Q8M07_26770 [Prosthecobacter sp.]|nr:hypothetical protein [Prosthecobacter sp.]
MKTPNNTATEFLAALAKLQFVPAKWDAPGDRQFDRKNKDGHTDLRIHIGYEGEPQPHYLSLVKFNGQRNQLIEWESLNLSAHMPTTGLMALIKAA